jgi:hypothetical protein
MTQEDLERIAKTALRELGAGDVTLVVEPDNGRDRWLITVAGDISRSLRVRAGKGSSAQFVRDQIFEQFERTR